MYINDVVTKFGQNSSEIILYAGYTILNTAIDSIEMVCETNQISVNILHTWCSLSRLKGPFHGTTKYNQISQRIIQIRQQVLETGGC